MKQSDFFLKIQAPYNKTGGSLSGVEPPLIPFLLKGHEPPRPCLVIMSDKPAAERLVNDLMSCSFDADIFFVGRDRINGIDTGQSSRALRSLLEGQSGIYVSTSAEMLQGVSSETLASVHLSVGESYSLAELESKLAAFGFERESFVVEPGSFSVRGGILDVFPGDKDKPLRLDFFGNHLESIVEFNPETQRSGFALNSIEVYPENPFDQPAADPLLNSVPAEAVLYQYRPQIEDSDGQTIADLLTTRRNETSFFFFQTKTPDTQVFDIELQPEYQRNLEAVRARLGSLNDEGFKVFLCADSNIQIDRLGVLFEDYAFDGVRLSLSAGFIDHSNRVAVLTDHQIFGRTRKRSVIPRVFPIKPVTRAEAFEEGDVVVHLDYGVGRYLGVELIPVGSVYREVLAIEYEHNDRIYVPVENMHRVHKYESHVDAPVKLTRLRTTEWEQVKIKTRKAVDNYAKELMELYANRFVVDGYPFSPDSDYQKRMEASFEYDETGDQITAVEEIKKDMESSFPMDRLLCGDVGFGKTEVAMRAVFKAVSDSKQVGVLVPTTVLAQQHYETFLNRFADYPIQIGVLSRFRTSKQVKETLEALKSGVLDVVIGTHRILSQDVVFKRLGLLVVDEEHRFGVKNKERIKEIKTSVDSLAMTATPIPRTLQMSLMGARDISMLKTPPKERQQVETVVMDFDEKRVKEAILREVDRAGQVFFVHNRVESIGVMLSRLQALLPGVRFGVGHGQMNPRELERVMLGFFHGEFDVLLSTTIVESGLDIPNANTIIVNRADAMGLSQLYQLRGRVGRSPRKAWAYFIAPGFRQLSVNAIRRLNALERHAHYGGGYEIAMRDLEIRGSGNVFGTEQSGHISNIGYQLYTKILKDTLAELKEQKDGDIAVFPAPDISTDQEAQIPASYIESTPERIAVYRRAADAETTATIVDLQSEMRERFGVLPDPVVNLFNISALKILGRALGVRGISIKDKKAQLDFLPEHVEQAGTEIIKSLSKAVGESKEKVELMNNKTLTLVLSAQNPNSVLPALRKFLESLVGASTFSD